MLLLPLLLLFSFSPTFGEFLYAQLFFIYTIHIVRGTHCVSSNTTKQVLLSRRYALGFWIRFPFSVDFAHVLYFTVLHCAHISFFFILRFFLFSSDARNYRNFHPKCQRKILHIKHSIDVFYSNKRFIQTHISIRIK